jgi:hypothetical protein
LLTLFLTNPDEEYYIRELTRKLDEQIKKYDDLRIKRDEAERHSQGHQEYLKSQYPRDLQENLNEAQQRMNDLLQQSSVSVETFGRTASSSFDQFLSKVRAANGELSDLNDRMSFRPTLREFGSADRPDSRQLSSVEITNNFQIDGSNLKPQELAREVVTHINRGIRRGTLEIG